ncbi:MAG: hypothetical protein QM713_09850 [Arachnia sp.]
MTAGTAIVAGHLDDPPVAAAWAAVERLGAPARFVDLARPVPELDWADVAGVYLRAFGAADPLGARTLRAEAEATPSSVRVVNRRGPAAALPKPAQTAHIEAAGFGVPQRLLTTDPGAARAFVQRHKTVVVTSTSAVRSIVRFASVDEDFSRVTWCPTQLQAFVPGVSYRAHVVGERVFAHEVSADDGDRARGSVTPAELPSAVAERCVALSRGLGLELAGLDLRHTPDDRWVCFEASTSPVWTAYDLDGTIADALARHLAGF